LEHFKVKQGFSIAVEWESLSRPYGRCAQIQNYIDGLQWIIYHQTIPVKRKQRDTFPKTHFAKYFSHHFVTSTMSKIWN
jgi:hypothetical protein